MLRHTVRLHLLILAGLLALGLGAVGPTYADVHETQNIVILASDDSLLPFTRGVSDSIVKRLRSEHPGDLAIFTEFMDASRVQGAANGDFPEFLVSKYADRQVAVVFALGAQAIALLDRERDRLFADVPVVFAGVRRGNPVLAKMPARMRGVTNEYDVAKTVELAAALQPDLRQIVLVSGASEPDRIWHERALSEILRYRDRFQVTELAGLSLNDLLNAVGQLSPQSAIIYLTILKDGKGASFASSNLTSRIAMAANRPIYSTHPSAFGQGIVGGYVPSYQEIGAAAAGLALPILSGAAAARDPAIVNLPARFQVDWRVMQRWQMDASALPAGTLILHRVPSLWAEHWQTILLATGVIVAQAAVIGGFWIQRRRRRGAERSLRDVKEHMEIAATTASLGLWSWRPADDRIWTTDHCRRMLGIAADSPMSLDEFLRFLRGGKLAKVRHSLVETIRTDGIFQRVFRIDDEAGRTSWLAATGKRIRHGHECLVAGTLLDITERRMAEIDAEEQRRQMIHLTRVAVLGELSGALAHELNQPLTAILSNAQTAQRLIARDVPDIGELKEILADIVEDDHRAGAVLRKLRTLVRREEAQYASLDLNQIVDDVLHLVHSDLIERQIQVQTRFGEDLPLVRGDRVQIQQVLINLVRNACDAMAVEPQHPHHLVLATDRTGSDLAVTVADNGSGVPENLVDRLFEPFVTTKTDGLGLGLAISRSILSAHGGKIWCESNAGGGAVFGFSLPAHEGRVT